MHPYECLVQSQIPLLKDLGRIVTTYAVRKHQNILFNLNDELISWNGVDKYEEILELAWEALNGGPNHENASLFGPIYASPIPAHVRILHKKHCLCNHGHCHFVEGVENRNTQTIGGLFAHCGPPDYDELVGKWYRDPDMAVIFQRLTEMPRVGKSCYKPHETEPCPLEMHPGLTYISFAFSAF